MIAAGQLIGNYRILAKIGTGGMGAVYLAEHPQIGKRVALKVIHRELAGNREVVQRFFQEAKAVNQIGNEHIVEVHDFGVTAENDHYYIMEYLEGRTLASVLAQERVLHVMRALHIGAQIAHALAATHAAGVIHRDLKPDNIMLMHRLGDPDFVKVLDFGLAKMHAASGPAAVKTAIGVLLGTPQYMSPEACESRTVDHRTDIYALGILLFQMMTGRLPFDGETMGEVLVKQVTALPPAPRGLNPHIPPAVEQILLRCLAKPVELRFANAAALRDALLDPEAYLHASPPIAPARSLAPGEAPVDANAVMAYAAQRARSPSNAPTMIAAGGSPSRAMPAVVPDLVGPAAPRMNTMRIATPLGYSSRPPRRMWPVVLVLGLLLGLGGGAFAIAMYGQADAPAAAAMPPGRDAAPALAVPADAPAIVEEAQPPSEPLAPPKLARITFDTDPKGATVRTPDGKQAGPTPVTVEWPVGEGEVTFEVHRTGYKKKARAMVVSGNVTVRVELERARGSPSGVNPTRGSGGRRGNSDTGLMRPDDL